MLRTVSKRIAQAFALAALVHQPALAQGGPTKATMDRAVKSVVQIIARDCVGGVNRTGSGFLWRTSTQVVTDLHVISGCSSIAAYYSGVKEYRATPIRALRTADLALLSVPDVPGFVPLSTINSAPPFNATLQVVGYYFGLRTFDSRPVRVTIGSSSLRDMLPAAVLQSWSADAGPDLSTHIVRLDGNLVPGLSGAPLIDEAGAVAGIGSGGLESGTVGISWAVRADYLNSLATAPAYAGGYHQAGTRTLFSSPEDGAPVARVRCGSALFYKSKSRTLKELVSTADDPAGLAQLASTSGMSMLELQNVEFDVYAEPSSGASIAVPAGATLSARGDECLAQLANGIRLRLYSAPASNAFEIEQRSLAFEARFPAAATGLYWTPDPSFTYPAPKSRVDGLVVRRKNGVGFSSGMLKGDVFETIMARGSLFVGIEVLNTEFTPAKYQQCLADSHTPDCRQVALDFQRWVAAVLGVHLSTFPQT
jgi:S1-C subfamily serine protease